MIPEEAIEAVSARIKKYDHNHSECEDQEACIPHEVVELGQVHLNENGEPVYTEYKDGKRVV